MKTIAVAGLDLAKNVFQIHGIDAGGKVVVRRQLRRSKVLKFFSVLSPCLVGIEACASAHHSAGVEKPTRIRVLFDIAQWVPSTTEPPCCSG
jgi:hypothetical protein